MNDADLRLDGNGVAGLLSEVFAGEMTAALQTCAGCGVIGAIGESHVYAQAPGVVLRCPACGGVIMCIVRTRDRLIVDMTGVRRVELTDARRTPAAPPPRHGAARR